MSAPLSSSSRALLEALSAPGAYGWESDGPAASRIAVTGSRNGISVKVASGSEKAARELESEGLAAWDRTGSRPRLHMTDAGRAKLLRLEAGPEKDPFRVQQGRLQQRRIAEAGKSVSVSVNVQESPLAWLAARKGRDGAPLMESHLIDAGERLRRDLTAGQIMPSITPNWSAVGAGRGSNAGMTYSDMVVAARQRVDRALHAVGPEFSGILVDVCGFLKGLELIESEHRWPARSAKVVLGMALARLARHYGYGPPQTPARQPGLRHWGVEDYRPAMGVVEPAVSQP